METERLILRHYEPQDLMPLHELLSNKENMYYLNDITTETLDETKENLAYVMANADGEYFCMIEKQTGEFVGSVGYTITDETPLGRIGHMGFFILPRFQGKGYTAEGAKEVLTYAFAKGGCIRVTTGCFADNVPSQKVIGKLGFVKEAYRFKAAYHDGEMKDRVEYGLNKEGL